MKSIRIKVLRVLMLHFVSLLSGTHFFALKRRLLLLAGIQVGRGTKVVGPIHMGTEAELVIGEQTWVGHDLYIEGNGSVDIGNRVDLAPQVVFSSGGHEIGDESRRAGHGSTFHQEIGDGCWIGIRSLFLNEIRVGGGCIVAGGAVVTKSIDSNSLVGGVPAKTIKILE